MKELAKKTFSVLAITVLLTNQALAQSGQFFREGDQPAAAAGGTLGQNITTMINYFLGLLGKKSHSQKNAL